MAEGLVEVWVDKKFSNLEDTVDQEINKLEELREEGEIGEKEYHLKMAQRLNHKEDIEERKERIKDKYGYEGEFHSELDSAVDQVEESLEEDSSLEDLDAGSLLEGDDDSEDAEYGNLGDSNSDEASSSDNKYSTGGEVGSQGIVLNYNSKGDKKVLFPEEGKFVVLQDPNNAEAGDIVALDSEKDIREDEPPYEGRVDFIVDEVEDLREKYVEEGEMKLKDGNHRIPVEDEEWRVAPELSYVAIELGLPLFDEEELLYSVENYHSRSSDEVLENLIDEGVIDPEIGKEDIDSLIGDLEEGETIDLEKGEPINAEESEGYSDKLTFNVSDEEKRVLTNLIADYNPPVMRGSITDEEGSEKNGKFDPDNVHGEYWLSEAYGLEPGEKVMVEVGEDFRGSFELVERLD